ncbi:oligopeptide:H+ symporter [Luteibacter anthropi]|uniref:POT family MFS transporter n=1 Tax=Luteibacter anthropi TaxID=564369 RepID=A0A7X5UA62_9GAMM|nr:oligopeptide:H+ symporter [Luteibacter anthropi]NII06587.1 POT family MFS transporter [Luteibacter anthropi]
MSSAESAPARARLPRQIPFIIGNEGCERFSFYGMRNILTPFLVTSLLMYLPESERPGAAKDVFHTFVIGVYFFPLLGGWLADRFLGKYRTVLWLSLVYCVGHLCLALFEHSVAGFYTGLALIAFGAGGIKPCVAAFVGDQFDESNRKLAKVVFDAFYWIINVGSFLASLLMPFFLRNYGAAVAFGLPGALMFVATVVFWMGRRHYVMVPPSRNDPHSFARVVRTALTAKREGQPRPGLAVAVVATCLAVAMLALAPSLGIVATLCIALVLLIGGGALGTRMQLERARGAHPDDAIDGVAAVLRVLVVFALVTPFWSLFDQKASTWVLQANAMSVPDWLHPAQMQALNPLLVLLLIPFNNLVLYPLLRRRGIEPTALRRMTAGIFLAAIAWVIVGAMQLALDGGDPISIAWQILPYVFLTMGEVLVSATGLEFAYSQAPPAMKGTLMSFWTLSVTVGNLWVLLANAGVRNEGVLAAIAGTGLGTTAFQMFFFAAFAAVAGLAFGLYARRYREVDYYRSA